MVWTVRKLTRQVAAAIRQRKTKHDIHLFQQMTKADEQDDNKEVWRLGRYLSRMGRGPRRRRYLPPGTKEPGAEEWRRFLTTAEGNDCCMQEDPEEAEPVLYHPPTQNVLEMSPLKDYMILRALRRLRRHRAVPYWAMPAEVWQLLAQPLDPPQERQAARKRARQILQQPESEAEPLSNDSEPEQEPLATLLSPTALLPPTTQVVTQIHHQVAKVGHSPQQWVDTEGVGVDKPNGLAGCPGKRPVMKCEPMGKVHSRMMDVNLRREPHTAQYGGLPGRSVREPVLILWALTWRLANCFQNYLLQLYDVTTAFPRMEWDPLFA
jgi:hypothetical protein